MHKNAPHPDRKYRNGVSCKSLSMAGLVSSLFPPMCYEIVKMRFSS